MVASCLGAHGRDGVRGRGVMEEMEGGYHSAIPEARTKGMVLEWQGDVWRCFQKADINRSSLSSTGRRISALEVC